MSRRADGSFKYDGHWRKVRKAVLERDGYRCKVELPGCTGKATQVDHIVPVNAGGAIYDMGNLRAACSRCNQGRKANRKPASRPSREW